MIALTESLPITVVKNEKKRIQYNGDSLWMTKQSYMSCMRPKEIELLLIYLIFILNFLVNTSLESLSLRIHDFFNPFKSSIWYLPRDFYDSPNGNLMVAQCGWVGYSCHSQLKISNIHVNSAFACCLHRYLIINNRKNNILLKVRYSHKKGLRKYGKHRKIKFCTLWFKEGINVLESLNQTSYNIIISFPLGRERD